MTNWQFRTVRGDRSVADIGPTYSHEHLWVRHPGAETLTLDDEEAMAVELEDFVSVGGRTIVDGTPADLGRDLGVLRRLSERTGVQVIASTGHYLHNFQPREEADLPVGALAERFVREVEDGADSSGTRVGQIKCAVSAHEMHPREERTLRAAGMANARTGAPVWVHHGGILGMEIVSILSESGADLARVVLGHADRYPDPWEYRRLARTGVFLSVDNLARAKQPTSISVGMIRDLADAGALDQVLISGDFGRKSYLRALGGRPGLRYILGEFVPRLREELGFGDSEVEQLLITNPARVFGFVKGKV